MAVLKAILWPKVPSLLVSSEVSAVTTNKINSKFLSELWPEIEAYQQGTAADFKTCESLSIYFHGGIATTS